MAERYSSDRSSADPDEDRVLVAAFLQSRDEMVFRKIYRRHTPALLLLAQRLVGGNRIDAEDVIQETWIRATKALPQFQWRSTLRTWLSGFVVNCAREQARTPKPNSEREIHNSNSSEPSIDLDRAIDRLPEGYRHVLMLHDIEGFTHKEIAGILDIEEGTSKSQLSHARESLRALLEVKPHERS